MQKKETISFGTIVFGSAFISFLIGASINFLFGSDTVEFMTIFMPLFCVFTVLGAIANVVTVLDNNKIEKASLKQAEQILEQSDEKKSSSNAKSN